MATDQEIRDAGFKYIPQQKYLLNPFTLPTTDDDGDNTPSANVGGNPEGFSVYNPDPNRTRNQSNYNERPYKSLVYNNAFPMMGDPMANQATGALNADGLMSYAGDRPLEGLPGAVSSYMKNSLPGRLIGKVVGGIEKLLPVNRRAIYENELLGQGIRLDDIGRIVSDGGNINTAENIMAGYNANKVTAETFQKRRDMINAKMKDPAQKAAKLAALDAAEAKMLGTATDRADMIFEDKMITKDPSLKGPGYLENAFDFTTEEDEIINPDTLRYITKKKAAETTGTNTTGTTGATDTSIYVPDGTPGGGDDGGANTPTGPGGTGSRRGASDIPDRNRGSYATDDTASFFAKGGRVYFFDGGRVGVMNGGLVSLL
jgi:hypothetical protein|tara:strand:- start:641 stop:1759 length:1119 start_codon:yes stop_codon:yes gene_type:complete